MKRVGTRNIFFFLLGLGYATERFQFTKAGHTEQNHRSFRFLSISTCYLIDKIKSNCMTLSLQNRRTEFWCHLTLLSKANNIKQKME